MFVDPVLPELSVATAVMVLAPGARLESVFDHVPDPRVAAPPFTDTLTSPPESKNVPETTGEPLTVAPLECDVMAMAGDVLSVTRLVYERMFDPIPVFPAASAKALVPTETVTMPVDVDGVTVNAYPVALVATNPVAVAFVSDRSFTVNPVTDSVVVARKEVAQVMVVVSGEESVIPGCRVSSFPVIVMPEAIAVVAMLPEYTAPL